MALVITATSHSGCASPEKPATAQKAVIENWPIGTEVNSAFVTYRIRNERQNSSSITGTTITSPQKRMRRNDARPSVVEKASSGLNATREPRCGYGTYLS